MSHLYASPIVAVINEVRNPNRGFELPDVDIDSYKGRVSVELGGTAYNAYTDISGAPWFDQLEYQWLQDSTFVVRGGVEELNGEFAWGSYISVQGELGDATLSEFYSSYLYAGALTGDLYAQGSGTLYFSEVDRAEVEVDGGFTVYLGNGDAEFYGYGDETQVVFAGADHDYVETGAGDDSLFGEDGHDQLEAGDGNDWLEGGDGNDDLYGGNGDDSLFGQEGSDYLRGNAGNDIISGGAGNDYLRGDAGNDTMNGNAGNDWLEGGDGNDRIIDGTGNDTYSGGNGADTFVFNAVPGDGAQRDIIADFDPTVDTAIVYDGAGNDADAYNDALASEGVATYGDHSIEFIGITPNDDGDWYLGG